MIRVWMDAAAAGFVRWSVVIRSGPSAWTRGVIVLLTCAMLVGAVSVGVALFAMSSFYHAYFDRENLPDPGPFMRFEFPTIGHIYDTNGKPLIQLAREYRQ